MKGRDIVVLVGPSGCGKTTVINELRRRHPHYFSFCVSHTTRAPRQGEVEGQQYYYVSRDKFIELVKRGEMAEYTLLFPQHSTTTTAAGGGAATVEKGNKVEDMDGIRLMERVMNIDFHDMDKLLTLDPSGRGTFYGTSKAALLSKLRRNKTVLMDTDLKGAISLHRIFNSANNNNNNREGDASSSSSFLSLPTTTEGSSSSSNASTSRSSKDKPLRQYSCYIILILPPSLEVVRKRLLERKSETEETLRLRMQYNQMWMKYYKAYQTVFDMTVVNEDLETCVREIEEHIVKAKKVSDSPNTFIKSSL